jgi:hypothetical protein
MKKFLLILLLLAVAAAVFFYLNPELRREVEGLLQSSGLKQPDSTMFYKWQDADGVWQYTQAPPPEGTPFERVETLTDVNVLPLPDELKARE